MSSDFVKLLKCLENETYSHLQLPLIVADNVELLLAKIVAQLVELILPLDESVVRECVGAVTVDVEDVQM